MSPDNLVRMVNRIGQYFEAYPDRAYARQEIASHVRRFWEPRMRRAIYAHIDSTEVTGLEPLVAAALVENRASLEPRLEPKT